MTTLATRGDRALATSEPMPDGRWPSADDDSLGRFAVIGGGFMGLVLAYRLAKLGYGVELFEASDGVGGVMRSMPLDGYRVDPFYHTILASDANLLALLDEVGLGDQTYFQKTLSGFWVGGRPRSGASGGAPPPRPTLPRGEGVAGELLPINSPMDLLRFRPLSLVQRFRLGLGSQICRLHKNWRKLDGIPVEKYLVRYCGRANYERFWRPLLRTKYDGDIEQLPATVIWSRIRRMSSGGQKKLGWDGCGYLRGGYQRLIDRLVECLEAAGCVVHTRSPVERIVVSGGSSAADPFVAPRTAERVLGGARGANDRLKAVTTSGVVVRGEFRPFDWVVNTAALPVMARMLPESCGALKARLQRQEYFGAICVLLVMRRQLSPYHTLYLLDEESPFTGIIETTHYLDRAEVGGRHLVYLSKYYAADNPLAAATRDAIREQFVARLLAMFPEVQRDDIEHVIVARERYVDPVRRVGEADFVPRVDDTGIDNLFLANNCQIYPRLPSGEAIVDFASEALDAIVRHVGAASRAAP